MSVFVVVVVVVLAALVCQCSDSISGEPDMINNPEREDLSALLSSVPVCSLSVCCFLSVYCFLCTCCFMSIDCFLTNSGFLSDLCFLSDSFSVCIDLVSV